MIKQIILSLIILLGLSPAVLAQTADIPALTGTGTGTVTERFIAGWYSSDGSTVPAATTQYAGLFGDSSPRTTETDVLAQATFYYNVTNFRIAANVAACGTLGAGEQFNFVLRKNMVATSLTGTCLATATANSFTVDTDIVAIVPGDSLSISVQSTASLLGRALRVGISLEGFKSLPVNVDVITDPVPDMTNEILDAFSAIVPFLALILVIVWAEITREWLIYILGVFIAGIAMVAVWSEIESLRLVIAGTAILLVARAYFTFQDDKTAISED